jgi:hypothetical protein
VDEPVASALHQMTGPFYLLDKEVAEGRHGEVSSSWGQEVSPPGQEWLAVGANSLLFQVWPKKTSYVRLDLWGGPPVADDPWELSWDGRLFLPSGLVVLVEFENGEPDDYAPFDLRARDAHWRTRVHAKFGKYDHGPDVPAETYDVDFYRVWLWSE